MSLAWVLAAALLAQEPAPVRVVTSLGGPALEALRAHLGTDAQVAVSSIGALGEPDPADVLFGVDVEMLAAFGPRLERYPEDAAAGLEPFHVDPDGRFLVPYAVPWVIAYRAPRFDAATAPRSYDGLLDDALTGELALPTPLAAPSLWVQWMQLQLRAGHTADRGIAWYGTLDARVSAYFDDLRELAAAFARGDVGLAVLPLDLAVETCRGLGGADFSLPDRPVVTGLGVALVAPGEDGAAATFARLLAPELASALSAHGIMPCPRRDGREPQLAEYLRSARDAALPIVPDPRNAPAWFDAFESLRGRGRTAEIVDTVLDLLFGVAFLVFLYFVYTRTRSTEA